MSGPFAAGWLVEALIASSILMAFVLLARKEAQRALGPQLAYWLWALPALRMAMPPLPASWRESAAAPITAASETVLVLVEPIMHPVAQAAAGDPFPWLLAIIGAWGLGALAFFAWHGLAHLDYVRRIIAPPAEHATLPDGTTLVESDEAVGPVAFGIFRRFVAVPKDFAERYDADERKLALAHELGHHARGDLIANWIALAMLAVHWFNPLAWIAYRKFRADQEMANDARVLAGLPPMERHAYACAIVKAAHGRAVTAACHLHTIEDLKGRLRMLKASRKSRRVVMAGAVGIASLTIAGLGLTASGAAAEKIRTVATTQVEAMTHADTTAPVDPVVEAAIGPDGKTTVRDVRVVVLDRAGKPMELGDGANIPAGAKVHRHRIVIRGKDGRVERYEGDAADAYLKAHPELQPPAPPAPAAGVATAPLPPLPPVASAWADSRRGTRVVVQSRSTVSPRVVVNVPEVIEGDCRGGSDREFVRHEAKGGQARVIICQKRIEQFAANQTRLANDQARLARLQAQAGMRSGLAGLEAGRRAIMNAPGMTDQDRKEALADIEEARAEMMRDIRESFGEHDDH